MKNIIRLFGDRPLKTKYVIEIIASICLMTCLVIFLLQGLKNRKNADISTISVENTELLQQSEPCVSKSELKVNKSPSKEHDANTEISKTEEESSEVEVEEESSEMEIEEESSEMEVEEESSEMEIEEESSEMEIEEESSEMEIEEESSEMEVEEESSEMEIEEESSEMEIEEESYEMEIEEESSEMEVEEEDSNQHDTINTHVINGVKGICQFPELPTGCEVTALTCLMNFWGIDAQKTDLAMNYMPRDVCYYKGDTLYGPNPLDTFAGDPSSDYGFGCFAKCLVRTFERYVLNRQELMKKYVALDLTGQSFETILQEYVAKDIPVLVIVSPYLREPYESCTWILEDGETWTWQKGHHAMVVYGFDLTSQVVYVTDSVYETGIATYPLSNFKEIYEIKGMSAMTILSK